MSWHHHLNKYYPGRTHMMTEKQSEISIPLTERVAFTNILDILKPLTKR